MAKIPKSVPVGGFFAPTDDTDKFGVTDPRWGIEGFSTWEQWNDILTIPKDRRRRGMLVFNQNVDTLDTKIGYFKLINDPAGDVTVEADWDEFGTGGASYFEELLDVAAVNKQDGDVWTYNAITGKTEPKGVIISSRFMRHIEPLVSSDRLLFAIIPANTSLVGLRLVADSSATSDTIKIGTTAGGSDIAEQVIATNFNAPLNLITRWFDETNNTDIYISGITAGSLNLYFELMEGVISDPILGSSKWDDVTGGINYAGGKVGIGTTTPSAKLHVLGTLKVTSTADLLNALNVAGAATFTGAVIATTRTAGDSTLNVATTEFVQNAVGGISSSKWDDAIGGINYAGGNVGIGTTAPVRKLHIHNADTAQSFGSGAFEVTAVSNFGATKTILSHRQDVNQIVVNEEATNTDFRVEGTTDTNLLFVNAGTNNVGIGDNTPSYKLDVNGTGRFAAELLLEYAYPRLVLKVAANTQDASLSFKNVALSTRGNVNYNFVEDRMSFRSGGVSDRLIINSGGNVSIGNTDDTYKLDVNGTGRFKGTITSYHTVTTINTAADVLVATSIHNYRDNVARIQVMRDNSLGHGWNFITNSHGATSSVQLYLDTNGNVGIGTTAPGKLLDVVRDDATVRIWSNNTGASHGVIDFSASNAESYVKTGDSLGKIEFRGRHTTGLLERASIEVINTGVGAWTPEVKLVCRTSPLNDNTVYDRLTILGNGNVGIGTAVPKARLHTFGGDIYITGSGNIASYGYIAGTEFTANTHKMTFGTTFGYDVKVDAMTIYNGNVGIGTTTPSAKLEIYSRAEQDLLYFNTDRGWKFKQTGVGASTVLALMPDHDAKAFIIRNAEGVTHAQFVTSNVAAASITYFNGRVGVGTPSPLYKLDVAGTGRFTSTVKATNFILSSDIRLKENIVDAKVLSLPQIKEFNFIADKDKKLRVGVIAQELQKVAPDMVHTDAEGMLAVDYTEFLLAKNVELEDRITKLEKLIKDLL